MTKAKLQKMCETINPFLFLIDFEASVDGRKIRLTDLTGANWGDIESERFDSAVEAVDRLDVYWDDFFVGDDYDGPAWNTYKDVAEWHRDNDRDYMADEIDRFVGFYDSLLEAESKRKVLRS